MEIKLKKEEAINLLYTECPMCHLAFGVNKRKKTSHHVIPLILKPKTAIKINLCQDCHEKLNRLTGHFEINEIQNEKQADNFEEFMNNYKSLRKQFKDKKLNRSQFGEGLWSNLVSFLDKLNEGVEDLKQYRTQ